ncbi:Sugar kinase of the NBD/HSP70 family, may contain an N-terminal HTH domain [Actinacidiphila glaucinigra]|uniref:Sugar kinase of the NBD/HSP70 family, may contain an N-terminal HTH domain n=2 Tax=Actinacidiphila glaucinigra TaxID=235986 RepID=A0A239EBI7_9ACTN|nr:Sugar kinase of the NBD/HSP70 family, may contain an N-terminal HTH domain [Actinacidiphila glaucinigra]
MVPGMSLADQPPAAVLVFQTLLVHGSLTRAEIGRRTGLSAGAVTKAATPLLADGWITELGRPAGERASGRPATPMAVRADRARFVGVKVTGDELIGVLTDLTARPLASRRAALDSRDVGTVVLAIARLIGQLRAAAGAEGDDAVHSVGVTISGDVDGQTGTVQYSPFLDWRRVPLAQLVESASGIPTVIENDVRALTVAEQWFGAGVGLSSFALVTVGAGIGCGLSIGGRVVSGAHGVSGEVGHLPVGGTDRTCTCGNTGCVETVASTHAITEQARQATGDPALTMEEAVRLAHADNAAVRAVFSRAGHVMGLAMASVANLIGPERIIISGEGAASYDLFADQIRQTFADHAFGAAADCDLVVRPLPFEEWARGGAAVAAQRVFAPAK